jgi:hypothetical protein
LPMPAETNTSHTGRLCEKTLHEHPRSCKASVARPACPLARPHGIAQQSGGKDVPSASVSICGILTDTPADAQGLLSGTTIRVPKKPGGTHLLSQKTKTQTNLKHAQDKSRPSGGAHGPGGPSGPPEQSTQPPSGETSASLEGHNATLASLRLARGPAAPSGEVPPRSRLSRARRPRTYSPDKGI